MLLAQLEAEENLPADKSEFFLFGYNSKLGDDQVRVTSCLSKTQDLRYMHCHVLLYLSCRMLKVFKLLLLHDLALDKDCFQAFKRLENKTE